MAFCLKWFCGLLGNGALLLGGSGAKRIDSAWLRKVAPYAERFSFTFYIFQNLTFALACAVMYDLVIWTGVIGAFIGILGSLAGILIKSRFWGLRPYQLAGCLWLLASGIGIVLGFDVQNLGVIIANIALIIGAICVMISHRAEF